MTLRTAFVAVRAAVCAAVFAGCRLSGEAPTAGAPDPAVQRPAPSTTADAPRKPGRGTSSGDRLDLALPTANRALLEGRPERFYMGVTRTVDSLRERRWEGGQYGFVRDPVPTPFGTRTFRRLHEGLDIAPLERDAAGDPVDTVRAVAAGRVAYTSDAAGASGYGRYVVVEHTWSRTPVYSLYAHLDSITARVGTPVRQGSPLGRMGYTGPGFGRDRAHVHLEIALLLNQYAPSWSERYVAGPDLHGVYYGRNLAGVDPAALYGRLARDPDLTFPAFVQAQRPGYRVDLPGGRPLDVLRRYPWLGPDAARADPRVVPAWRVTFTAEGVPIGVAVGPQPVERPTVVGVSLAVMLSGSSTNRVLTRSAPWTYTPSSRGMAYFALLATTAGGPPAW